MATELDLLAKNEIDNDKQKSDETVNIKQLSNRTIFQIF